MGRIERHRGKSSFSAQRFFNLDKGIGLSSWVIYLLARRYFHIVHQNERERCVCVEMECYIELGSISINIFGIESFSRKPPVPTVRLLWTAPSKTVFLCDYSELEYPLCAASYDWKRGGESPHIAGKHQSGLGEEAEPSEYMRSNSPSL